MTTNQNWGAYALFVCLLIFVVYFGTGSDSNLLYLLGILNGLIGSYRFLKG